MTFNQKEKLAQEFCSAIRNLADDEEALNNFESYLSYHFDTWLKEFASTPEGLTSELKCFSEMYKNNQIITFILLNTI